MSELHNRKLNRAKFINYNSAGFYFITICTKDRKHLFGEVVDHEMKLNQRGKIVDQNVLILGNIYEHVFLKNYVIMPNHLHFIIELGIDFQNNSVGTNLKFVPTRKTNNKYNKLSKIIAQFKLSITKQIRKIENHENEIIWQRSFHDHLIRNEEEYYKIYDYISENPNNWQNDSLFK